MILWDMKTLGKLVRERRESAGYKNQRDFADALDRAQSWVSRLEADRMMGAPSPEEMRSIATAIPLTVAEMLAAMGYDVATGTEDDTPALAALRPIIESHDWEGDEVEHIAHMIESLARLRKR